MIAGCCTRHECRADERLRRKTAVNGRQECGAVAEGSARGDDNAESEILGTSASDMEKVEQCNPTLHDLRNFAAGRANHHLVGGRVPMAAFGTSRDWPYVHTFTVHVAFGRNLHVQSTHGHAPLEPQQSGSLAPRGARTAGSPSAAHLQRNVPRNRERQISSVSDELGSPGTTNGLGAGGQPHGRRGPFCLFGILRKSPRYPRR